MALPEAHIRPTGFQQLCDWVIGSRQVHYKTLPQNSAWGTIDQLPRTIFVDTEKLQEFFYRLMPCIRLPFVLIVGDHDMTTPRQTDKRYERALDLRVWESLLKDDRLIHVFVEHLDELDERFSKISAIPTGINAIEYGGNGDAILPYVSTNITDLMERPLMVLQVDRRREGSQWEDRHRVFDLCNGEWKEFCRANRTDCGQPFFEALKAHPFVFCVHGGGKDPNPKAWEALLAGSIPIIEHFAGYEIYRGLPVVILDSWTADQVDVTKMQHWRTLLRPYFEDPSLRAEVLRRLTTKFWWGKVKAALDGRLDQFHNNVTSISLLGRDVKPTIDM